MAALPGGPSAEAAVGGRYELAGPQTLSYEQLITCARATPRPVRFRLHRPPHSENALESRPPASPPDEAKLLGPADHQDGLADAESLGVTPKPMGDPQHRRERTSSTAAVDLGLIALFAQPPALTLAAAASNHVIGELLAG